LLRADPKAELLLEHRRARFLRSRGADGRFHVFLFFRRRQHRLHSERGYPQLTTPAFAVVKAPVFLLFNLFTCLFESAGLLPFGLFSALGQEFPIQMVFSFRQYHALACDEFHRFRLADFHGHLDRLD
jgi:hypothetical protein